MKRDYIILEGESYLDALKEGLTKLKLDKDQVHIEVLVERKPTLLKKGYVQLRLTVKEKVSETKSIKANKSDAGEILIEITEDKLEAYITIVEGEKIKDITFEDVFKKLKENHIVYGIDYDKLKTMIEEGVYNTKVPIAIGKKAIDGKDGELVYHFDVKKEYRPEILEDGTVNFKQLNLINNVKKDDLLIEIILPEDGRDGFDVVGRTIFHKKGKLPKIIKGKNIKESEDGLKLYADTDGQVLLRDEKIQVSEIYEIAGDVDNTTGNIQFNGKVMVRGNIKSGFIVEAAGDIEVNGVVEGATLIAKGNIFLKRGIQGNNQAYLEANGDLIAKYIENAKIKVLGNVETDCIMHSIVVAKENIIVKGKRGLIVGGQIRALKEIDAKIIGSHMGTATTIEVGVDPDERQKYNELRKEQNKLENNLSNLKKTIMLLDKLKQNAKLTQDKEKIFVKSLKTYEYLKDKYKKIAEELEACMVKIQDSPEGKIHVSHKIYPRVKIEIANAVRHVYDTIPNCTLYKNEGEVMIGSYEK